MIKIFLPLILLFLSINIYSQELLFQKEVNLKSILKDKRESLPIVNTEKNETLLFLLDKSKILGLRFNLDYELIDDYSADKPINRFDVLLGHSVNSKGYHLFFTNKKKDEFFCKTIDISNKNGYGKEISLKLKGERFLESISYNQKFYLVTIEKKSSILNVYVLEGDAISNSHKFDFSAHKFSNFGLYEVFLDKDKSFDFDLEIQKIDNSNPNSLDLTSKRNKIYFYNNKIYLTVDNSLSNTKVISISLDDFSSQVTFYDHPTIDCGEAYLIRSNSFLLGGHLYQIKGCRNELSFHVTDLSTNVILKAYSVKHDEAITFSNTPLIQEKGNQEKEMELNNTRQLLRKISTSDIGIVARLSQDKIELIIGGIKDVQQGGGGGLVTSSGSTISTPFGKVTTPSTNNYNSTMYGYSNYANTRSVYFKSQFDKVNFNHVSGNVADNAYDKIAKYVANNNEGVTSETIFKVDDYYVFGYYGKWNKVYHLMKFED